MAYLIANVLEYILVFIIIIGWGSPYAHAILRDYYLPEIGAILIILLFFLLVKNIKLIVLKNYVAYFVPYFIVVVLYMILRVDAQRLTSFAARFLVMLPISVLLFIHYSEINRPEEILNKYVNIMACLSAISLFFWLLGSQYHFIRPTGNFLAYWGADTYFNDYCGIYFEAQHAKMFGYDLGMRNQGIFCEAPMYSLNLVFSIAICIFLLPESNRKILNKRNLLIVTLITTFTTTGYILLVVMISLKVLRSKKRRIGLGKLLSITVGIPLILWLGYIVLNDKITSGSWLQRMDDFVAGLQAWFQSPLLGNGWYENETIIGFMSAFRSNTGYSNSIMQILAQGGITLFSVYFIPILCSFIKSYKMQNHNVNSFIIIFILEFIFTIFTYSMLILLFLAFFISFLITDSSIGFAHSEASEKILQPRFEYRHNTAVP